MADKRSSSKSARKRKRSRSAIAGRPSSYRHLYQDKTGNVSTEDEVVINPGTVGKGSDTIDWHTEYSHVIRDLRRLAVVSILIFAAMIGVGYVL